MSSAAAAAVGGCKDLVVEIMSLVPAKSVLRFRCASKRWNALLSDPFFLVGHTRRNPHDVSAIIFYCSLQNSDELLWSLVLPSSPGGPRHGLLPDPSVFTPVPPRLPFQLLSSTDGLAICASLTAAGAGLPELYVCNTTTMQHGRIPFPAAHEDLLSALIVFDGKQDKDPHRYHVVCVTRCRRIHSYSSASGAWRGPFTHRDLSQVVANNWRTQAAAWNGAANWLRVLGDPHKLLSFDVETQRMREVPFPPFPPRLPSCRDSFSRTPRVELLAVSRRRLHLVTWNGSRTACYFDLWEMRDDWSGWLPHYRVDLTPIPWWDPHLFVSIRGGGKEEDGGGDMWLLHTRDKLVFFSARHRTFQELSTLPGRTLGVDDSYSQTFIQTLCPP